MLAAAGGVPASENVSVCAGEPLSVAVAVNVYAESSGIVAVAGTPEIDGAEFTSVTSIAMAASVFAVRKRAVKGKGEVPGARGSVKVKEKTPDVAPRLAPAGGVPASE